MKKPNIKTIVAIATLFASITTGNAREKSGHFTVYAGANMSKINIPNVVYERELEPTSKFKPGFDVGLRGDFFKPDLTVSPCWTMGLGYVRNNYDIEIGKKEAEMSTNSLEILFAIGPEYRLSENDRMGISLGGMFGAVGGTEKDIIGNKSEEYDPFESANKRAWGGLCVELWYTHSHLFLNARYGRNFSDYHLNEVFGGDSDAETYYGQMKSKARRSLTFNIGYRF